MLDTLDFQSTLQCQWMQEPLMVGRFRADHQGSRQREFFCLKLVHVGLGPDDPNGPDAPNLP